MKNRPGPKRKIICSIPNIHFFRCENVRFQEANLFVMVVLLSPSFLLGSLSHSVRLIIWRGEIKVWFFKWLEEICIHTDVCMYKYIYTHNSHSAQKGANTHLSVCPCTITSTVLDMCHTFGPRSNYQTADNKRLQVISIIWLQKRGQLPRNVTKLILTSPWNQDYVKHIQTFCSDFFSVPVHRQRSQCAKT